MPKIPVDKNDKAALPKNEIWPPGQLFPTESQDVKAISQAKSRQFAAQQKFTGSIAIADSAHYARRYSR